MEIEGVDPFIRRYALSRSPLASTVVLDGDTCKINRRGVDSRKIRECPSKELREDNALSRNNSVANNSRLGENATNKSDKKLHKMLY